jgi:uncharacterized protein (TIGR00251 family)
LTQPGIRASGDEVCIDVRVTPRASKDEVVGWDASGRLRVKVTPPPDRGAANRAVLALLAEVLGVAKGRLRVSRGVSSREKTLRARGVEIEEVRRRLRHRTEDSPSKLHDGKEPS